MATIKIPRRYDRSTILLADDEPEHLEFLVDYLHSKGYQTIILMNVRETIEAVQSQRFRAYIIDLNIPLGDWVPPFSQTGPTYDHYRGLYIIKLVRSQGNSGKRVIAYSAHYNDLIVAEIKRLYCGYIVKGRPRELKANVDDMLQREPRDDRPPRKVSARPVKKRQLSLTKKMIRRPSRYKKPPKPKSVAKPARKGRR